MQDVDHNLPLFVRVLESWDVENLELPADIVHHRHQRGGTDGAADIDAFDADDAVLRQRGLEARRIETREQPRQEGALAGAGDPKQMSECAAATASNFASNSL